MRNEILKRLTVDGRLPEKYVIENMDLISKEKELKGYCQWSFTDDGIFIPANNTVHTLESGFYEIKNDHKIGLHMQKIETISEELFILPSPEINNIIDDIKKFWSEEEKYRKYKYVHKRGILLYGDPGGGKSGIIQLCIKYITEVMDGIVINIKDQSQVEWFDEFIQTFRKIEPNRPLVVILEDLDALTGEDKYITSKLLNILDGIKQIDGVVYLASTNYPEKLEERISNRPSRFDRRYRIDPPTSEIRKSYLEFKLNEDDLKGLDMKKWIKDSEGFSLAHLKELVISVFVLGNTYDYSIQHLKDMGIRPKNKGKASLGFNSSR